MKTASCGWVRRQCAARYPLSEAIVKYKTRMRKSRTGLCTRWLAKLPVDAEVPILLKPGYLTLPPREAPLILIGPGTGCASLRSLVLERLSHPDGPLPKFTSSWASDIVPKTISSARIGKHSSKRIEMFCTCIQRSAEMETTDVRAGPDCKGRKAGLGALRSSRGMLDRGGWCVGKMPEQVREAFEKLARSAVGWTRSRRVDSWTAWRGRGVAGECWASKLQKSSDGIIKV